MMTLDLLMCGSGPEMFQGSVNGHAKSGFYFFPLSGNFFASVLTCTDVEKLRPCQGGIYSLLSQALAL